MIPLLDFVQPTPLLKRIKNAWLGLSSLSPTAMPLLPAIQVEDLPTTMPFFIGCSPEGKLI